MGRERIRLVAERLAISGAGEQREDQCHDLRGARQLSERFLCYHARSQNEFRRLCEIPETNSQEHDRQSKKRATVFGPRQPHGPSLKIGGTLYRQVV